MAARTADGAGQASYTILLFVGCRVGVTWIGVAGLADWLLFGLGLGVAACADDEDCGVGGAEGAA